VSVTDSAPPLAGAPAGPVLAVVGWSGSGKTTLLEFLVARLAARGLRVNVVKHSHHDIELEPPRKDSARLRMAGAAEVMIASPYRYAILRELRGEAEPPLAAQLARLSPADLTLVEGYKWEPLPKLEVYRPALGRPALHAHDHLVVAVASDVPPPAPGGIGPAWLDLNAPEDVLRWLVGWMEIQAKVSRN
jgi:molybdopterin-guanine dinucleotide biosynthesis protein B